MTEAVTVSNFITVAFLLLLRCDRNTSSHAHPHTDKLLGLAYANLFKTKTRIAIANEGLAEEVHVIQL